MNHLAHFHLASALDLASSLDPTDGDWLVGALLGDFVKGPLRGELPARWEEGIRLHRRIDALSDDGPLRAELAARLPPELRRYAGIILDVCCDHWLTRQWSTQSNQPLPQFAAHVYTVLDRHAGQLPERPQRLIARLREYDLLCSYAEWAAVPATLRRIGTRLTRANPLTNVSADALIAARALEGEFPAFYCQLKTGLRTELIGSMMREPEKRPR